MGDPPKIHAPTPGGSDSSESDRNAKSVSETGFGEPLTATTTPGGDPDESKDTVLSADEATVTQDSGPSTNPLPLPPSLAPYPGPSSWDPPPLPVTFDDHVDVDSLSDPEDTYRPRPSRYRSSRYRYPEERTLEEKISKAPKQVSQIVQYTKLMEERVQALEREVELLKAAKGSKTPGDLPPIDYGEPYAPPGPVDSVETVATVPMLVPEIRRVFWKDYDGERATHSLDIIYGEQDDVSSKEAHNFWKNDKEKEIKVAPIPGRDGRPSRIRIQSRLLRTELRQLTEYDIMFDSREVLSPFKPFVESRDKIRDHLKVLEERLRVLQEKEAELLVKESEEAASKSSATTPAAVESKFKLNELDDKDNSDKGVLNIREEGAPEKANQNAVFDDKPPADPGYPFEAPKDKKEKTKVKKFPPPVFPREPVPEKDLALDEKGVNPQDIGALMLSCKSTKDLAISYLITYAGYDEAQKQLVQFAPPDEVDEHARQAALLEAYTLVEEWKAVLSLIDTDLCDTFTLLDQIKDQTLDKIAFEDLGHLFAPGQMVLESAVETGLDSDAKNQQLLQVFSSTGGRRILDDGSISDPYAPPPLPPVDPVAAAAEQQKQAVANVLGNLLHNTSSYSQFMIDCYYIDFDGYHFGPVQKTFAVSRYDGRIALSSLPVYPSWYNRNVKFVEEPEAAAEENGDEGIDSDLKKSKKSRKVPKDPWTLLLERGQKFAKFCDVGKVHHRHYCGLSLDEPAEEIDSKVIVDFKMASLAPIDMRPPGSQAWVPKLGILEPSPADEREVRGPSTGRTCKIPNCTICPPGKSASPLLNDQKTSQQQSREFIMKCPILMERSVKNQEKLADDDYRLMPCRVFGFVLRSRKWARMNVDNIRKINHEENNFEKLVLPEGYADLVQALVETHTKTNRTTREMKKEGAHEVDLVRGKGKGLIILLHGAPGVGKTSTAECVADHTRRPLFPITCGDIGDTAADVEKNLERCFQLAHKWGCVMLLDEADVFLAERSKTDLQRNALVSVFLRVLEYYAGILFLTTNRVGTFDEAFKSRIHMSLGYPPLGRTQAKKIWRMNLKRTQEAKDLNLEIDTDKILEFADEHWEAAQEKKGGAAWNGRQIRNAFQTAIALAKWNHNPEKTPKATLDDTQFQKVADASRQFDEYLKEVYGGADDAERAAEDKKRADNFQLIKKPKNPNINSAKFGKSGKSSSSKSKSSGKDKEEVTEKPKKKKKKEEPPPPPSESEEEESDEQDSDEQDSD